MVQHFLPGRGSGQRILL